MDTPRTSRRRPPRRYWNRLKCSVSIGRIKRYEDKVQHNLPATNTIDVHVRLRSGAITVETFTPTDVGATEAEKRRLGWSKKSIYG